MPGWGRGRPVLEAYDGGEYKTGPHLYESSLCILQSCFHVNFL